MYSEKKGFDAIEALYFVGLFFSILLILIGIGLI